ncbi:MAG: cbb3-type cytochrome oxidase assembly protein CcoS [Armatimonadetes bacterium]|nr:cbb3-type cytochrome oxidase assembly protein CcoS [Armatimonadota bacterium]
MPNWHTLAEVLPVYHIVAGMTLLFAALAIAALVWAWKSGIFDHVEDLKYRVLDVEDKPLGHP